MEATIQLHSDLGTEQNLVNKQMEHRGSNRLASLVLMLASWLLVTGCQPENVYQEPPPPPVTVAHPELRTVVDAAEFTGTTEAVEMVDIRARVEGFLISIDFEEGTAVKKGDLLFQIDPRPFQATLAQANASVELAKARQLSAEAELARSAAEVVNAKAQVARIENAIAISPGAVTREELDLRRTAVLTATAAEDAAKAAIASAMAEIAAGKAMVQQAKLDLSYTQVRSPIDGRAGRRLVDIGNLVGATDSTLLTNVVRYDPVYGFFTVSETDLLRFNRKQIDTKGSASADVEIELDQTIYLGLGDEEGYPHKGKADFADLAVDQSTGTYLIRGVFPNAKRLIPPGAFIRVQVPRGEIQALLIDERAVGRDQAGPYLLILDADNKVERRTVQLVGKYDGLQAVKGPISTDDRVVVNGLQRARPGSVVAPQQQAAPKQQPVQNSTEESVDDSPSPPVTAE